MSIKQEMNTLKVSETKGKEEKGFFEKGKHKTEKAIKFKR